MIKIAIAVRGPIRPSSKEVIENIKEIKQSLLPLEGEIDTYLITWSNQDLSEIMASKVFDNYIILKEPPLELIEKNLTARSRNSAALFDRNYKAFFTQKTIIDQLVKVDPPYDWIISTRTDLRIVITDIKKWLKPGHYSMPTQERYPINDQFGIAEPGVMLGAWNYNNLENLNAFYSDSDGPEDCLLKIMQANSIKVFDVKAEKYELNLTRHFQDKEYPYTVSEKKLAQKIFLRKFLKLIGLFRPLKHLKIKKETMGPHQIEAWRQKIKFFIRDLLPNWFLKIIRRRQVPLNKMLDFLAEKRDLVTKNLVPKTIAIIVPCYRHAQFLEKTFSSIVNQTKLPNQVILIDDFSPDGTKEIIHKLISRYQELSPLSPIDFIIHRNEKNLGQSSSLNKAISLAQTDLIMVLNDDDYLMHDAVEIVLSLFQKNTSLALLGFTNINFDNDDFLEASPKLASAYSSIDKMVLRITKPEDALKFENYCSLNMTHTGSTFVRTKAISAGLYREKADRIIPFSDRDFQIRMNLLYPVGTDNNLPLCFWRTNSSVDGGLDS